MSFLRLSIQAGLRDRWRAWLALTLLTVLIVGLTLAGAQTARQTATAFPRFVSAHGYDAFFYSVHAQPKADRLPDVSSVTAIRTPISGSPACACDRPINLNDFSVDELSPGDLSRTVKLTAGAWPDQSNPDQVLASSDLAPLGVHVGSVLRVPFASPSQRNAVLSNESLDPNGPTIDLRVVGLEISEIEFPSPANAPSYDVYTTTSFAQRYDSQTFALHEYFFRLRHGAANLPQFEAKARTLGGLSPTDLDALASSVTTSIDPQAVGWWLLTALAALVGAVVLGQALARQIATEARDYPTFSALGATRKQLLALTLVRTLAVAVVGAIGGLLVAFALSSLMPVGEAALADPTPGLDFDPLLLVGGAAAAIAVVLGLSMWPAWRAARPAKQIDDRPGVRPSRIVSFLVRTGAPPSTLIGVRHALEPGEGRGAVPVGSAIVGSVLAVTVLCGTAIFGASLSSLTSTPTQYGQQFEAWLGANNTGGAAQNAQLLRSIERPGVTAVMAGVSRPVRIDGTVVDALAGQSLRGPILLSVTSGRLPTARDELVLGAKTMRQLGLHVGSWVHVNLSPTADAASDRIDRVVGTTVLPPDFNTQGLGMGAIFTVSGLRGSACTTGSRQATCLLSTVDADNGVFIVQTAPGEEGRDALASLGRMYPSQINYPRPPTDLVNFGEAVDFPLIFGVTVVLFGLGTLLHLLLSSLQRRRHEMGLLKGLGMVRRQLAATVSWQTTTVALIGIVLGVPLGVAAGRLVWNDFAANLGVGTEPVVQVWVVALLVGASLVGANLLAIGPALLAARTNAASLLGAE